MLSKSWLTGIAMAVKVSGTVNLAIAEKDTGATLYSGCLALRREYHISATAVESASLTVTANSVEATASERFSRKIYASVQPRATLITCSETSVTAVGYMFPLP